MKILVTGSNGFLGKHLCLKLLNQGHTVYGLVRTPDKMGLRHPQFIMIKGDLGLTKLPWIDELPNDLEACIHAAGLVHSYNIKDLFNVNTLGTQFLLESLKLKFQNKFKFILVSSLAAAGPCAFGETKIETDIDFPICAYGRSKKEAENILKAAAPKTWTLSIVRPPMVIGPGDPAVLDIFKMVKNRIIILPGRNGKLKEYSFVSVFDLINTLTLLIESDRSLLVFSAHDTVIKYQELIEEIKKQMNIGRIFYLPLPIFLIRIIGFSLGVVHRFYPHQMRLTPDKIRELQAETWTCDPSLSKKILKQTYEYNLNKCIEITLADYKKRDWI